MEEGKGGVSPVSPDPSILLLKSDSIILPESAISSHVNTSK